MKSWFERITGPMDPEFSGVRLPEPDPLSPGELYHEASKLFPITSPVLGARIEMFLSHKPIQAAAAHPYKTYSTLSRIALPTPSPVTMNLTDVLRARQCVRAYAQDKATPIQLVADWLGWGCGLMERETPEGTRVVRTYPSGGGLYPLETYLCVRRVEGLEPRLYHYNLRQHSLEILGDGDVAEQIFGNLTQADVSATCHFAVIFTAVFMRLQYKYGERGYRFALIEAGHAMQNLCLLAPAVGLGMVPLGGFYDDKLHDLLGVNGVDEAVLYVAAAGLPDV